MADANNFWYEQAREIFPSIEIRNIELHHEGLINDILIVNHEWVARITKTEWGEELMDLEDRLLRFLKPHLSLNVPASEKRGKGVLVYRFLEGTSFSRETWMRASEDGQTQYANQLGQFLRELHGIPTDKLDWEIPLTLAPVTWDTWMEMYDKLVQKVKPLLLPHQIEWMESLFKEVLMTPSFFDYEPVLIHGDLVPYHILYSPDETRLTGVIDFGTAGMGDPATDLGSLINSYGERLVSKLADTYPDYDTLLPRARFYAQAVELQWVLLGVETNEYSWFTAHLGGARDIH